MLVDAIVAVLVRASPYDAESWILVGLVLGPLVAALIGFGYGSGRISRYDAELWIVIGTILGPAIAAVIMLVGYSRFRRASR